MKKSVSNHFIQFSLLFFIFFFSVEVEAQFFTRVTDAGAIVTDSLFGIGTAWGDYNNDGFVDLLVTNLGAQLYKNNGDGTFDRITDSPVETIEGIIGSGTWGDYNNDGYLDLYLSRYGLVDNNGVYSEGVPDNVYMNSGPPNYTLEQIALPIDSSSSTSGGWADADNDGWLDLFIPRRIGNSLFFSNNLDGTFTELTDLPIVNRTFGNANENWIDYDNDGDIDLFMSIRHGVRNELFKNMLKETGRRYHFVSVDTTTITNEGNVFDINSSWGDYDNDGDFDVFIPNNLGSPQLLYRNDGGGKFVRITDGPIATMSETAASGAWGDYDNDGDLDLFVVVGNPGFVEPVLFNNIGGGNFERIDENQIGDLLMSMPSPQGASWCDYDNDGDLDAYVLTFATGGFNGTKHPNYLFKNNLGNQNNWVIVKCIGNQSNHSAIGTKLRVKANIDGVDVWQSRYIATRGVSGINSQYDYRLHFGLGNASIIDSIKIEWPSRIIQVLENVQPNQILTIEETMPEGFLDLNFYADTLLGKTSLTVNFEDGSFSDPNHPILSIEWDLNGDGIYDNQGPNVTYEYTSEKDTSFSVSLKVANGFQTLELTRKNFIHLTGPLPSISVDENVLSMGALPKESGIKDTTFMIYNYGDASDIISISVNFPQDTSGEAVSVTPSDFEIAAIDSQKVTVKVNPSSLAVRVLPYTADLIINANENPDKKEFKKAVRFNVVNPTGIEDDLDDFPINFRLAQNYPNPFNPSSKIKFQIAATEFVELKVYSIIGKEVATLINEVKASGHYEIIFDGRELPSGIYFYRLKAGSFEQTRKMLLLK